MGFTQAVTTVFGKYADFTGRARRSEFWFWILFSLLGGIVFGGLDGLLFGYEFGRSFSPLGSLFNLAILVPSLAVGARRLHDMNHTGWWQLIALTGIGGFALLIWWCFRGTEGPNRFGADPLDD